ncbi:MAG: GWxTD domain-containing protein [Gemmatimonadales bacterium]
MRLRPPSLVILAALQATPLIAAQQPPAGQDTFGRAGEAELDSLYGPLLYLMTEAERGIYPGLSTEERREFLRAFWRRRDPTPRKRRNEALEDFYARVRYANGQFREGGAAEIPGWRTDRGRIYLRHGPPEAILSRPHPASTNPYEAWKYPGDPPRLYVFFDVTRFGNYVLLWTNDRGEPSRPDWKRLLGPEALDDIARF